VRAWEIRQTWRRRFRRNPRLDRISRLEIHTMDRVLFDGRDQQIVTMLMSPSQLSPGYRNRGSGRRRV
jgi:hypothetical protein